MAQMEASCCTECDTKTEAQYVFRKKPCLKNPFLTKTAKKIVTFRGSSKKFQRPYILKSWGVLGCIQCVRTLLSSYQKHLAIFFFNFSF